MPMTGTHLNSTAALKNVVLNLTYTHQGLTRRQLATLIGVRLEEIDHTAETLIMEDRAFETRTIRQTTLHCAVARLDPLLERPEYEPELLQRLARAPDRADTALHLARGLPISANEAAATLERAALFHKCRARNIGGMRVFAPIPTH